MADRLSVRSGASALSSLRTFYSAEDGFNPSLLTISTYFSVEDPTVLQIANTSDLRAALRPLDVTDVVSLSSAPLGFGGQADVLSAELGGQRVRKHS